MDIRTADDRGDAFVRIRDREIGSEMHDADRGALEEQPVPLLAHAERLAEPVLVDRDLDDRPHLTHIVWLQDIPGGAASFARCIVAGSEKAVANTTGMSRRCEDLPSESDAVLLARQTDIQEDNIRVEPFGSAQPFIERACRGGNIIAGLDQTDLDIPGDDLLVLNDEDARLSRRAKGGIRCGS